MAETPRFIFTSPEAGSGIVLTHQRSEPEQPTATPEARRVALATPLVSEAGADDAPSGRVVIPQVTVMIPAAEAQPRAGISVQAAQDEVGEADPIAVAASEDGALRPLPETLQASVFAPLRLSQGDPVFDQDRVRLAGERASRSVLWVLPPGARPEELVIHVQSSAYVLSEDSLMRVTLNGVELGRQPLTEIAGSRDARFAVPSTVPLYVRNVVEIDVAQTHRVACGYNASFELWTDVYLRRSGTELPGATYAGDDLATTMARMAAAAGAGESIRVRIMGTAGEQSAHPARMDVLAQIGDLIGGPLRYTGAASETQIALTPELTGVAIRPDGIAIGMTSTGRADLSELRRAMTGPNDVALVSRAVAVTPDRAVTLAGLGLDQALVRDHFWSRSLSFELPAGYHSVTGDRAELRLTYAHVAGLTAGSAIRVYVNNTQVRIIPIDAATAITERDLPVRFDAALLDSGLNALRLDVTREAPRTAVDCVVDRDPVLEIGTASTLVVPRSPAFRRETLGSILTGLSPQGLDVDRNTLLGTRRERQNELANLYTIAAALPWGGGKDGDRLVVLSQTTLDAIDLGAYASSREGMIRLMRDGEDQAPLRIERNADPSLLDDGSELGLIGEDQAFDPAPVRRDPFDAPDDNDRLLPALAQPGQPSNASVLSIDDLWNGSVTVQDWVFPHPPAQLRRWIARNLRLEGEASDGAMLFQLDDDNRRAYFIIGEDASLPDALEALHVAMQTPARMNGHFAIYRPNSGWQVWADRTRLPELMEPLSLDNAGRVVGTYAGARPREFALLLIIAASITALCATVSLLASRRNKR
ncbi:MAG: cellulose biosynthesis cyclic di-GMP-binding regulatory protein BcsB [Rhodobacteraceae bacterium]|nr:cellulose biosynthesis cyclic di-GMP-binding regulatory protein BcsB [Paracoccaceae bacterium]